MISMLYQMHALGSYPVLAENVHCHLSHWVAEQAALGQHLLEGWREVQEKQCLLMLKVQLCWLLSLMY